MRREHRKALHALADEAVASLPGWSPTHPGGLWLTGADRCFTRPGTPTRWLVFAPHPGAQEAFTIEVGWAHGPHPDPGSRPAPLAGELDPATPRDQDVLVRLNQLGSTVPDSWEIPGPDPLDVVEAYLLQLQAMSEPVTPTEARARLAPLVERAVEALRTVGLPWLERLC